MDVYVQTSKQWRVCGHTGRTQLTQLFFPHWRNTNRVLAPHLSTGAHLKGASVERLLKMKVNFVNAVLNVLDDLGRSFRLSVDNFEVHKRRGGWVPTELLRHFSTDDMMRCFPSDPESASWCHETSVRQHSWPSISELLTAILTRSSAVDSAPS